MSTASKFDSRKTVVIYDGECPFCQNYVLLMNLRNAAGDVLLLDAREHPDIVESLLNDGLDINEGMSVVHGGEVYFGEDAVVFISSVTRTNAITGKLIARLLGNKWRARLLYPILKAGRRLTLAILGVSLISSPRHAQD
jgi:predicted DCC family thiol-disulfide oxidoreductase YuxK